MNTPGNYDFEFDLTASDRRRNTKPFAAGAALVAILFIVLTMSTDLASRILPMKDDYLQAMIPLAPDGMEPLSLKSLDHEIIDKTISVRGSAMNRTEYPIAGLTVVVNFLDTTGRFGQTLDVPLEPSVLSAQGIATFQATATLQEKPAGYTVKFHFVDGPFIPHKDERVFTFDFPGN